MRHVTKGEAETYISVALDVANEGEDTVVIAIIGVDRNGALGVAGNEIRVSDVVGGGRRRRGSCGSSNISGSISSSSSSNELGIKARPGGRLE
jgi:hypothetical protein